LEYHSDIFVHINEEKKGLGRLRLTLEDGTKATVDILDFHAAEKKSLKGIKIKNGESLICFHHNLFRDSGYNVKFHENSKWFHGLGKASDYYYFLFLHFIAHGVLFELFSLDDREKCEAKFFEDIVAPNIERIQSEYGLKPMIVRSYPEKQTDEEDFYWWCYPPHVNDYLVRYAREHSFTFKPVKF